MVVVLLRGLIGFEDVFVSLVLLRLKGLDGFKDLSSVDVFVDGLEGFVLFEGSTKVFLFEGLAVLDVFRAPDSLLTFFLAFDKFEDSTFNADDAADGCIFFEDVPLCFEIDSAILLEAIFPVGTVFSPFETSEDLCLCSLFFTISQINCAKAFLISVGTDELK